MRETETVKEYSDRLISITNKVRLLSSSLVDSRIVQKILVTIPERFEATITTLENTKDMSKISLEELLSALQAQEQRRVMRQEGAIEEPKSIESKKVRIGNGEHIVFKGKGTVAISSCSGTKFISDVLYVPDIDQNLISVGQLVENGFKVKFMEKTCVIENATSQKMFEVEMKGRSFSLNLMQEEQWTFLAKESTIMLWHKRLGHYHHQGIVKMKSKSMTIDLPEFDDRIITTCKACQFGKQNRKSFPKTALRATYEERNWDEKSDPTTADLKFKLPTSTTDEDEDEDEDWLNEMVDDTLTRDFATAMKDTKWVDAMKEELSMIEKNKTWKLVDRPQYRKEISVAFEGGGRRISDADLTASCYLAGKSAALFTAVASCEISA
ncbi:hypothetical protein GQ457_06G008660 [Hibiscus cannabinus]